QLSVNSGTHDTHPCPITGYPHAFDDRINTLPLGAGILQPAQYDYAAPFADQEPIGPSVERPDLLAARQRTQLGEYTPERCILADVHAGGQRHIRPATAQLADGVVDRH